MGGMYDDYNADDDYDGLDSLVAKTPRLSLAQSNTEEMKDDSDIHLEGLKRGLFFSTKGRTIFGPTVQVRVMAAREVWTEWSGNNGIPHKPESVEIVNRTSSPKDWKLANGNKLNPVIEFAVLVVDHEDEGLMSLSFKGNSYKTGRNTLRSLKSVRSEGTMVPIWAPIVEFIASKQANDDGDFYVIGDGSKTSSGKLVRDAKGVISLLDVKSDDFKKVQPLITQAKEFKNALPAVETQTVRQITGQVDV